ncbi:MAG: hypothetical protein HYY24_11970 [Verrucomicrobia bacterium]|nr:hypothetical protein [Verrucomicrobiota bacterium]
MNLGRPTRDYLTNGASKGERNARLFDAACQLRDAGLSQHAAEVELIPRATADGLSEPEARAAVASAYRRAPRQPVGRGLAPGRFQRHAPPPRVAPAPTIDPATRCENWLNGFRADWADVWEASPIRPPDDWRLDGVCLLGWLYQPGERLNIVTDYTLDAEGKARPAGYGVTLTREQWIERLRQKPVGSKAGAWLRMNPTDGKGIGDANITACRFCLLESDALPVELQLSVYVRLKLPIAAILTSGGRSLHAWIKVNAPDAGTYRAQAERLRDVLALIGIDRKNKNASRLSRLPGARREIGAVDCGKQRVLYLTPDPIEGNRIFE